ncbi:MAG: thiol peroxidase [Alistipes sp.]|nr:thiol peroxidase [Alistipes sp.]
MEKYSVLFKGKPVALEGTHRFIGDRAPQFTVVNDQLEEISSLIYQGKIVVLSIFPSVDTSVCALQNIRFNHEATRFNDSVQVLSLSVDLPFAQKRFCAAEKIDQVHIYSDYRYLDFGTKYGFVMQPLRLLARGVVVIDRSDIIRHIEYVTDVGHEPDYQTALRVIQSLEQA